MIVMEVSIVVLYLIKVSPRDHVFLFFNEKPRL